MSTCYYRAHRILTRSSTTTWKPFAHHLGEVERKFLDNITDIDEDQINQFRNSGLSNLTTQCNSMDPESYQVFHRYFNVFNRMFFFHSFNRRNCTIRMIHRDGDDSMEWEANKDSLEEVYGHTLREPYGRPHREIVHCPITIFQRPWDTPESRLKSYIETLLHEMVDAFIVTYTCGCEICQELFAQEYGQRGHGETWHAMATALEETVTDRLGIDVSLGIPAAMSDEWYRTNADLDGVDLRRLDRSSIEKLIEQCWFYNGDPSGENDDDNDDNEESDASEDSSEEEYIYD
ncbi:uncharacterized protein LY89DRAFT_764330 [Mollisia scopiformis]|uniref:Uncharacterized protein n=1 Tax=Mollisia scopiformis TaxID=149040 RepID=A0A132B8Y3_MOLSC|nr:uncharacterized protein LY89DRAFT_764330 [Mollisia scopiformis]KUJ08870.1 hypothetical protein LY89DRAFT_764330 [Mollisia scopiformis]